MLWTWLKTKPKGLGASLDAAQMHGPWVWKKAWSSAQHDNSDAEPKTNPMHGDTLTATGGQVGIATIGCMGGIVCAAHTVAVAATRNARHAAPNPRRAIVVGSFSRWTGLDGLID